MSNGMELQQVIYDVFRTQIQFGAFSYAERLPTIEEAAHDFMVSVKTVRAAYLRLQCDGYITISKSIGVKVSVQYSRQDTETHIQQFFAERKDALMDMGKSLRLLFSNAQWLGFKNITPELLDQIEQLTAPREYMAPYIMIQQHQAIYGTLGNSLLMRLVWQAFIFFQAPFLSVSGNLALLCHKKNPLLQMTALCREQNWPALRTCVDAFHEQKGLVFRQFYEERIQLPAADCQAVFEWSVYKKASQLCYSLGMELLVAISKNVYPPDSLLPSLNTLAKEKGVSVNTVRRTMTLLNDIGATKSINGVGTMVLPPDQIARHCDLSQASVQERLYAYAESMHILALSCKQVAEATIRSMNRETAEKWKENLVSYEQVERYELVLYAIMNLISKDSPLMAIRTVYRELFLSLFWGYPMRSLKKDPQRNNAFYRSYYLCYLDCLDRLDADTFSAKLEELMKSELKMIMGWLVELGITEVTSLMVDE